ncbi:zinc finger protein 839 [Hoplias malabaricus]|uniref:zinc finger protein 839 n=1 Tax=Hoplias malabaricus TaxID=27720 RepID=UPI003461DF65
MADTEEESGGGAAVLVGECAQSRAPEPSSTESELGDAGDTAKSEEAVAVEMDGAGTGLHEAGAGPETVNLNVAVTKEVEGGCQEVIGHILGTEVLTSYVQTEGAEGADCATVSADLLNALSPATTIIYVQPDGSFVESSGLSAEEQQQLIEQLSKQHLVQVTGNEAARIFEQPQTHKTIPTPVTLSAPKPAQVSNPAPAPKPVPNSAPAPKPAPPPAPSAKPVAIAPVDVQQVIDHVNKTQVIAQTEPARVHAPKILQKTVTAQPTSYITLEPGSLISGAPLTATIPTQPFTIVQNAAQQLQTAAKQVALQQTHNEAHPIQPKPSEPIHIQVQAAPKPEIKQHQAAPITILQPQSLPVSQPLVKVSTVATVSTPQIIHITPVPGQQQYFLQNPGEPPIQLLLQKPAPVVSSISVPIVHKVQAPTAVPSPSPTKNPAAKPSVIAPPQTLILTPTPPTSVASPTTKVLTPPTKVTTVVTKVLPPAVGKEKEKEKDKEKPKEKNRQKKALKIQTRSGRVSRPPKHKVKDYKFIKNEDLAESHQSDSDDYSEISVEDEEGDENKKKMADDGLSLRKKAFKCETCEKAYIGLAGLNRHYRLNTSHNKSQTCPPEEKEAKSPEKETVTEAPKTSPVKAATTQKVQADSTRPVEKRRPGRPKGSGKSSLPKRLGRKPKRGRRGRPPKYLTAAATVEQQEQRRRVRLTEFIRQYDDEDLMEIVLPRLAKVMTVWEFVLMKVEKGHPSRQQFPSVYHEFEQLHSQVKKMAQEHFSISPASRPALEINNMEVLKSLGVTDLRNVGSTQSTVRTNQATKSLQSIENTKMLPPAKRFKMENCGGEKNDSPIKIQNGIQKDDASNGSTLLREPQVVLTRLENFNSVAVVDGDLPSCSETPGARTEEEPMDTGIAPGDLEAAKLQEPTDKKISEDLNSREYVDVADQMEQLEQALSSDVPESAPQEGTPPEGSSDPPQVDSLVDAEMVEEPAVSHVIETAQAEEIFIQTAEGLVRQSAEELASKGIVIVNGPDGTTMHIEAPEGVPLETVHALLGIETERQT